MAGVERKPVLGTVFRRGAKCNMSAHLTDTGSEPPPVPLAFFRSNVLRDTHTFMTGRRGATPPPRN